MAGTGSPTPADLLARAPATLLDAPDVPTMLQRAADLLADACGGACELHLPGFAPVRAGAPQPPAPSPVHAAVPVLGGVELRLAWWPPAPPPAEGRALAQGLAAVAATALAAHTRGEETRASLAGARAGSATLERLLGITSQLAHSEKPADVARIALESAFKTLGARAGTVALLDAQGARLDIIFSLGYPEDVLKPFHSFPVNAPLPLAEAMLRKTPILVGDASILARSHPHLAPTLARSGSRAVAAIPLVVEGRPVGVIGLSFGEPRAFTPQDRGLLEGLAGQAAQALERARLLEAERAARAQAEAATRRLTLLLDASTALSTPRDFEAALESLARLAVDALGGSCTVYLRDGDRLAPRATHARDAEAEARLREVQSRHLHDLRGSGGLVDVFRGGRPVLVPVVTDEMLRGAARDEAHLRALRALGLRSSIVVPLRASEEIAGVIALSRLGDSEPYREDDLAFAGELARRAGLALENARLLQAAREAEGRLENIVRSVPGVVWEAWGGPHVSQQRIGFVSAHVQTMLGYTVDEWLSTPNFWLAIVHPDDREKAALNAAEHFARGGHDVNEFRWVAKDGRVLDVLSHSVVVQDDEGRAVGMRGVTIDVTGRKRAEERLRLYREIFLASRDAIAIIDAEGRYAEQNEAHRRLTGYEDEDILGRTPSIHLGEAQFAAIAEELSATGHARGEYVSRSREGRETHVDLSAFSVRDGDGRPAFHVGIKRDITRRKEVEAALRDRVREVEAFYRMADHLGRAEREDEVHASALDCATDLLDAPRSAVVLLDDAGVPRYAAWRNLSAAFRDATTGLLPRPSGEADAGPLLVGDVAAAEDLGGLREALLEEGVRSAAFFPLVDQGRLAGLLAVYHDEPRAHTPSEARRGSTVAGQLAFSIARVRAEDALRRSETWLRTIFDSLDEVVLFVRYPDRLIGNVNLALRRLFGYERDEVIGQSTRILHVDDDHFKEYGRRIAEAFQRGEPARFEFTLRRKDGTAFPTEQTVSLLKTADGRVLGGLCVVRDLTEKKRALAELESARRQVATTEKLSALGSLVSGVAHEIRTPLAYITNHLFLMEQRIARAATAPGGDLAALHHDVARHSAAVMEGVDRINRIVGELRRFTRLKAGEKACAPLDLVVLEAVDLFRSTHRGRMGVLADLQPCPEMPLDRVQVQQVVLNLLDNAADAMDRAGTIRVATRAQPGGVELSVTDEGPGIPPEVQTRMFDPLFTTKKEGTGLGLSIVRRIVEAHGGTLRYDTELGRGTTFRIHIPVPTAPGAPPPPRTPAPAPAPAPAQLPAPAPAPPPTPAADAPAEAPSVNRPEPLKPEPPTHDG